MRLHVFNPEHDIALARNVKQFTAPFAGRQLRSDCGFLPAIWASDGDYVFVDDKDEAIRQVSEVKELTANVNFIEKGDLCRTKKCETVEPWGWDMSLAYQLCNNGLDPRLLPKEERLENIRRISNRKFSSVILKLLVNRLTDNGLCVVGESIYVNSLQEMQKIISIRSVSVLKAPWSSSGRGVRYVDGVIDRQMMNWANNIIKSQGGIMVEPRYNKVIDFALEFVVDDFGISYKGLSLFETINGAYRGNVLSSEAHKEELLGKYIGMDKLRCLRVTLEDILRNKLVGVYAGPIGVDMMIVSDTGNKDRRQYLIHPMVEMNVRRTMGHVAIEISRKIPNVEGLMRIMFDGTHYHLSLVKR